MWIRVYLGSNPREETGPGVWKLSWRNPAPYLKVGHNTAFVSCILQLAGSSSVGSPWAFNQSVHLTLEPWPPLIFVAHSTLCQISNSGVVIPNSGACCSRRAQRRMAPLDVPRARKINVIDYHESTCFKNPSQLPHAATLWLCLPTAGNRWFAADLSRSPLSGLTNLPLMLTLTESTRISCKIDQVEDRDFGSSIGHECGAGVSFTPLICSLYRVLANGCKAKCGH